MDRWKDHIVTSLASPRVYSILLTLISFQRLAIYVASLNNLIRLRIIADAFQIFYVIRNNQILIFRPSWWYSVAIIYPHLFTFALQKAFSLFTFCGSKIMNGERGFPRSEIEPISIKIWFSKGVQEMLLAKLGGWALFLRMGLFPENWVIDGSWRSSMKHVIFLRFCGVRYLRYRAVGCSG